MKKFKTQEAFDQHTCGPMWTGTKGNKTTTTASEGRSGRKRANLGPKEEAEEGIGGTKNKKKKENIPSSANKPTKGTGGIETQNANN